MEEISKTIKLRNIFILFPHVRIFTTRLSDINQTSVNLTFSEDREMEQWCERGQHFSFMLVEIVSTLNIPNAEFVRNVSLNLSILTHPPCGFNKENSR